MLAGIRDRLTYANVMATIAVFIALGGTAYAAATVNSGDVVNESLKSKDLKNNAAVKSQDVVFPWNVVTGSGSPLISLRNTGAGIGIEAFAENPSGAAVVGRSEVSGDDGEAVVGINDSSVAGAVVGRNDGANAGVRGFTTDNGGTGVIAQGNVSAATGNGLEATATAPGNAIEANGASLFNGNVTVADGSFLKLAVKGTAGAPATGDCDAAAEAGRMVYNTNDERLYLCDGTEGWRSILSA